MSQIIQRAENQPWAPHFFGAVILAAGRSSRMKAFKPLLPVGGMSALERQVSALQSAGVGRIVIVTGYGRDALVPVIRRLEKEAGGGIIVEARNFHYEKGMFSSIKTGLAKGMEAFGQVSGFFLMPVDCPLISSGMISKLAGRITEDGGAAALPDGTAAGGGLGFHVPVFEGKKGHPLFVPQEHIAEICGYAGPGGLKAITDKYHDRMIRVPVEEEGCVMDMDTPEGYAEIQAFLEAGCRRPDLRELAAGRRIFLVRHGETEQHAEKMFIGRYDVPLEGGAEARVERMARRLAAEAPAVSVIYTSPLKRAHQTARILRDVLHRRENSQTPGHFAEAPADHDLHLCIIEDLQEIHLGEWDGRPISWVRENHPEEYRRRGRDLFAFKFGNQAENFYDVQYRAVKALGKILQEDASKDIIIVTHNTVIRALENNLKGIRVDDAWVKMDKNDYKVITFSN